MEERTGEGKTRRTEIASDDLHDLAGGALPHDGPQATADVMHFAAMADATMDVAGDTAREHEVEKHRPVVGGDGGR